MAWTADRYGASEGCFCHGCKTLRLEALLSDARALLRSEVTGPAQVAAVCEEIDRIIGRDERV